MATFTQSTYRSTQYALGAGDGLTVAQSGSVIVTVDNTSAILASGANSVTVNGYVSARGAGVQFNGGNNTVTVGSLGNILATSYGISFSAGGNTLVNAGLILGDAVGIRVAGGGDATTITNTGRIICQGSDGIYADAKLILVNSGSIESINDGIDAYDSLLGSSITNNGSIIGRADNALDLSNTGDDVVINNGYLQGANGILLNGGNDFFDGRNGIQVGVVNGGNGNDILFGGSYADQFIGGVGADTLYGGAGDDRLEGGNDSDILRGDAGADIIIGGAGFDYASWNNSGGVVVNMLNPALNTGDAAGDVITEVEGFYLSEFNDVFIGQNGANIVFGLGGSDSLFGGMASNDWLFGGDGNDFLSGGVLNDLLSGGAGNDTYAFTNYGTNGFDQVLDFTSGGDRLQLSASGFGLTAGSLFTAGFNFIASASPTSVVAGGTLLYNTTNGILMYDIDGTGGQAPISLAQFAGNPFIQATDFIVI